MRQGLDTERPQLGAIRGAAGKATFFSPFFFKDCGHWVGHPFVCDPSSYDVLFVWLSSKGVGGE